jgi:hypothetical protein
MPPDPNIPNDQILWHQSGVNAKGEAFVQLLRGTEIVGQMSAAEARDHAHAMLETAEAAETDAFLLDLLQHKLALGLHQAGAVLQQFRAYRVERTGKQSGPRNARDWVFPKKPPK